MTFPLVPSSSALGNVGKLSYWSMGMGGANKKPILVKTNEGIYVPRESMFLGNNVTRAHEPYPDQCMLVGEDGNVSSKTAAVSNTGSNIIWPAAIEESACFDPYVLSLFPPNTLTKGTENTAQDVQSSQMHPSFSIQIRSFLHPVSYIQSFYYPFLASSPEAITPPNISLRLLTPSSASTVYAVSAPIDRTALISEGTTIWRFTMKKWLDQVDELIDGDLHLEALTLMSTLDSVELPEKVHFYNAYQTRNNGF